MLHAAGLLGSGIGVSVAVTVRLKDPGAVAVESLLAAVVDSAQLAGAETVSPSGFVIKFVPAVNPQAVSGMLPTVADTVVISVGAVRGAMP